MKTLALLFVLLPVAALASESVDQLRMQQAREARTACADKGEGPENSGYASCVNDYLQSHYGWRVVARRDGSLHAATGGYVGYSAAGSIGGSGINDSNNTANYEPQALH